MSKACIAAASGAVLLVLAGCAATDGFTRANTTRDQMVFDLQTCRGLARAELDSHQYYARERDRRDSAASREIGRSDGTAAADQRLAEAGYRRDRDALIADCMAQKGYRRGKPVAGESA